MPIPTPELDKYARNAPRVVFDDEDYIYNHAKEILLEMLRLADVAGATCEVDEDDDVEIIVDEYSFNTELDRLDPMPSLVSVVNEVLWDRKARRNWNQVSEPDWDRGTICAVLVDGDQLDAILEHELILDSIYDPRECV